MLLRGARRRRFAGYIVFDSFTRADSAVSLGTSDTGHAWTAHVGTWGVSSNKAYCPTASGVAQNLATVQTNISTATVQAIVSGTWATGQPWLLFRYTDTSNYMLISAQTANTVEIFKNVAGAFTQIGTGAYTWGASQLVSVAYAGTSISVSVDGVVKATANDAANQSATRAGIGGSVSLDNTARFDNFTVSG